MKDQPPKTAWRQRRRLLALLSLVLGAGLLGFFGLRAWHQAAHMQRLVQGEVQIESLRGWMTLPYIAQTYRVPEAELRAALGLPAAGFDQRSLKEWLAVAQLDREEARRRIEALVPAAAPEPAKTGSATPER